MHKTGIVCAAQRELEPFLPHIEQCSVTKKAMLTFYEGKINGASVVAVFCGVCKTNAAVAAQILIDTFGVSAVINAGTAGGMHADVGLLDIVVATQCAHHDVHENILTQYHPWMPSRLIRSDEQLVSLARRAAEKTPETRVLFGTMATGEQFIDRDGREIINSSLAPLTVDMETASIAQVCYVNQIPFLAVRCVTDTEQHHGETNFEQNVSAASARSKDLVLAILGEMN